MKDKISEMLVTGWQEKRYTAGILMVVKEDQIIYCQGVGPQVAAQTRFDLASLTKVTATLPAILYLINEDQLKIEQTVAEYLPSLQETSVGRATIRQLLTHTAGLPPFLKFYQLGETDMIKALRQVQATYPAGSRVVYSDIGFMILGKIVESISGEKLDVYCREHIFQALEMTTTDFSAEQAIPTRITGAPDDSNARFFGGVAGHAGLFSSAADLAKYVAFWLKQIASKQSLFTQAIVCQTQGLDDKRGLGWTLTHSSQSFFDDFSGQSFGHSGFTGTSLAIDPKTKMGIVFLTNRVYNGANVSFVDFRQKMHRLIWESFGQ